MLPLKLEFKTPAHVPTEDTNKRVRRGSASPFPPPHPGRVSGPIWGRAFKYALNASSAGRNGWTAHVCVFVYDVSREDS